jgi:transcriptional regulator with XRE-family HTH domain
MRSKSNDILPAKVRLAMEEMGNEIHEARRSRKLTAAELSDQVQISRPTLQKVEAGDPSVTMGVYATVLYALGLTSNLPRYAEIEATQAYDREMEGRLLAFYDKQHKHLDKDVWQCVPGIPPEVLAATAKFLAGTDWYGHKSWLSQIAQEITPGIARKNTFLSLVKKYRIPFYRFSPALRQRLSHGTR